MANRPRCSLPKTARLVTDVAVRSSFIGRGRPQNLRTSPAPVIAETSGGRSNWAVWAPVLADDWGCRIEVGRLGAWDCR